ncbi:hypothetical protein Tco_1152050 [Tanacetum coccineum]
MGGGGADAQTRPETTSKTSHDPPLLEVNTSGHGEDSMEYHDDLTDFIPPTPYDSPLSGGNTPGSDEGRMELILELMKTCASLTKRVLALEEAMTAKDKVITRLKLRVKRLEKKRKARTPQPMKRRLFKGRVETFIDKSLVIVEDKGSGEKGGSTVDQVSTARLEVSAASVPVNIRSEKAKEKEKGVVLIDEEEPPRLNRSTTTLQPLPTIDPKDKGKGVLVEEEPEKLVKVKRRDQGLAQRLHEEELAELDRVQKERQKQEEATSAALDIAQKERQKQEEATSAALDIAQKERQKQEEATSAALAEEFDEIQARIDVDHELVVRLTHEEQEKYTIEERADY